MPSNSLYILFNHFFLYLKTITANFRSWFMLEKDWLQSQKSKYYRANFIYVKLNSKSYSNIICTDWLLCWIPSEALSYGLLPSLRWRSVGPFGQQGELLPVQLVVKRQALLVFVGTQGSVYSMCAFLKNVFIIPRKCHDKLTRVLSWFDGLYIYMASRCSFCNICLIMFLDNLWCM